MTTGTQSRCGTTSGYVTDGCRCEKCRRAWREYRREYYRRARESRRTLVPAEEVWPLVECLVAFGLSRPRIARAAGVSFQTLYRSRRSFHPGTAEAIRRVHWSLWWHHGPFRAHCGCAVPKEVRERLEGI